MLKRCLAIVAVLFVQTTLASEPAGQNPAPIAEYSVDYTSEYRVGWFSFDIEATRTLSRRSDQLWNLTFNAEASIASLNEISDFLIQGQQIVPVNYSYRSSGVIDEDDRTLHFMADSRTIEDTERNRVITDQWQDGIQDNLTYMLQAGFYLSQGLQEFSFPVFEKKKTKTFHFKVVGEETIKTKAGSFDAIKVQQVRKDKKREIYAWFAKVDGYPMIRLRDRKNGDLRYQIQATRLSR